MAIRSSLHCAGFRFRKDLLIRTEERKCRPDVVFTRVKLAVFIDGCFWHLCPQHGHIPTTNMSYWESKLKKNIERDALDTAALERSGWKVLRIWEHTPVQEASDMIIAILKKLVPSNY
jgi:DNA mismatch endonuclease (patch repair protein)